MERKLYSARLERKICISEIAQCYHFNFVIDELESFPYVAGQFVSTVAADNKGKQQTRAYSVASASSGNRFDLCVNRVEGEPRGGQREERRARPDRSSAG